MKCKLFFFVIIQLFFVAARAQEKVNTKFGDVNEKSFATKIYSIDSSANAVVITDFGSTKIEGNSKGWFSLIFKHYKRVHILNKNGYDAANVSIPLYVSGLDEVKLSNLKAVTYNLENGKVVETKLDQKLNVFKEQIDKNWAIVKFTFPNVKEGAIVEFEYTTISDFINHVEPWEFQGDYPVLWSEYNFSLPDFLGYVFFTQGYKKYHIKDRKTKTESFRLINSNGTSASDFLSFSVGVADNRWVIKDIPVLKEENFITTLNNHTNKLEFQLSELRDPLTPRVFMASWPKAVEDLMNAEFFGQQLTKDNGWLKEVLNPLLKSETNKLERLKKIYAFVRDNFTCVSHSGIYLNQSIKNVLKTKKGTVSEINLLLCAMLRYEEFQADPVLLSTRSHGVAYADYPIMSKYNYVIVKTTIDGTSYFLDATEPRLGFGYLPLRCYNGHARAINASADSMELESKMINEQKFTSLFVINDNKGSIGGRMQQTPGYYASLDLRNRIKENGVEKLQKDIQKAFGSAVVISNFIIDSLDNYESKLGITYDFDFPPNSEDIIYLNPMFGEGYRDNPFKSAQRLNPVEMPYAFDEVISVQIEVPQGYEVDELPQSLVVKLNEEGDGVFEYRISQSGTNISFRSRIKISHTFFLPEEYDMLREFFGHVVKKQSEHIVFKKKK